MKKNYITPETIKMELFAADVIAASGIPVKFPEPEVDADEDIFDD